MNFLWGSIFLFGPTGSKLLKRNLGSFFDAIMASRRGLMARRLSMMAKSPSLSVTLWIKFNVSFARQAKNKILFHARGSRLAARLNSQRCITCKSLIVRIFIYGLNLISLVFVILERNKNTHVFHLYLI